VSSVLILRILLFQKKGFTDLLALHEFVVKVSVFMKAAGAKQTLSAEIADLFSKYAGALADQGLLVTASKYCRGDSEQSKILRDRLYRSRASQDCLRILRTPPPFPFSMAAPKKTQASANTAQSQPNRANDARMQNYSGHAQQQQQQQQIATSSYHNTAPAVRAPSPALAPQLPEGWIALQDPSSGKTYYANQTTGQTSWDPPAGATSVPIPQTAPAPAPQPTQRQYSMENNPANSASASNSKSIASKYGDGFVSSSSHPELAHQYGNVGTRYARKMLCEEAVKHCLRACVHSRFLVWLL